MTAGAAVVDKWTRRSKSTSYLVLYEYEASGSLHRRQAHLSSGAYNATERGGRIDIRYARSEPAISRLTTEKPKPSWMPIVPFSLFMFAVPIIAVQLARQKRLLQTGRPVPAFVTRVAKVKGGRSVSYQFMGATGNVTRGAANVKPTENVQPGGTVTVIHDVADPSRNTIYPPQLVALNVPGRR